MTSTDKRPYKAADTYDKGVPHITGTLKIVVGAPEEGQRTWELPKALLSKHSAFFAAMVKHDSDNEKLEIPTIAPRDFQNFVYFMHSSIYSLNDQVEEYRNIRAHTAACVIGIRLEAKTYFNCALRKLYLIFHTLAKAQFSNARLSPIRASDIEYVCEQTATAPKDSITALKLKQFFFDALAAHWTQSDALFVGYLDSPNGTSNRNDAPFDTTTWSHVYNTYPDFRTYMANSAAARDASRVAFLRPENEYLDPPGANKKKKQDTNEHGAPIRKEQEVKRPRLSIRMPGMKRSSNDRRRRGSSGASKEEDMIKKEETMVKEEQTVAKEEETVVKEEETAVKEEDPVVKKEESLEAETELDADRSEFDIEKDEFERSEIDDKDIVVVGMDAGIEDDEL